MAFNKDRFVTLCQQLLVTAAVSTLALTAASVVTLDIVGPDGLHRDGNASTHATATLQAASYSEVDTGPVKPDVAQVPLSGSAAQRHSAGRSGTAARPAAPQRIDGLTVAVTSAPQRVGGYATVGAVWDHGVDIAASDILMQVRTLRSGHWSGWQKLTYHDDHGPDGTEAASANDRPGSDPFAVGHVDKVQLRVATVDGRAPKGLDFALIDPGSGPMKEETPAAAEGSDAVAPAAPAPRAVGKTGSAKHKGMAVAPRPKIFTRHQWGADESIRESGKPDYGTIKTGFVHHTVNANKYSRKQVPSMIRGIYAYHVKVRGWRDIGYNFLVDRFGRIWEGRYGGINRPVVGAHTLGYNEVSFAMSAIGNFEIARPPKAVIRAFARLFAWKLSKYGIRARANHLWVKNRYLHAINGHRDVGQTACPGKYLYAKLPAIRKRARQIQKRAQHGTLTPQSKYNPARAPTAAKPQPKKMKFPAGRNVAGNSHPDLVLQSSSGALSVLSLGGMTGFDPGVRSRGSWAGARVVAIGDVTGDRHGDVLTRRTGDGGWRLHLGTAGNRVRPAARNKSERLFKRVRTIIPAGDWNHDGRTDVLGIDKSGRLIWYKGRGKGRFARARLIASSWPYRQTVVAGDLDGDGHPDLVGVRKGTMYRIDSLAPSRLGGAVKGRSMAAYDKILGGGDMSGDGVGDLWVREKATGNVRVMLGDGHGRFAGALGPFRGFGPWKRLSSAHMNAGKRPDIVGLRGGHLVTRVNNDRDNVRAVLPSHLRVTGSTRVLNVGDWDGDGHADIMTRQARRNILVLHRGHGNGRFTGSFATSAGWRAISRLSAVGDVTGDHHPDLVGRTKDGQMVVFRGDGKQGFQRVRKLPRTLRTFNTVGGPAWHPRGFPGSALRSTDGSLVPFGGDGARHRFRLDTGTKYSDYNVVVGVGDVDGDGRADLLARDRVRGTLWLIPGKKHGFGRPLFVASGLGKYRIG